MRDKIKSRFVHLSLFFIKNKKYFYPANFSKFSLKKLILLHNIFTTIQPQKSHTHVGNIKLYLMARSSNNNIFARNKNKGKEKYFMIDQFVIIRIYGESSLHVHVYQISHFPANP